MLCTPLSATFANFHSPAKSFAQLRRITFTVCDMRTSGDSHSDLIGGAPEMLRDWRSPTRFQIQAQAGNAECAHRLRTAIPDERRNCGHPRGDGGFIVPYDFHEICFADGFQATLQLR
jgi:hypothetical protein